MNKSAPTKDRSFPRLRRRAAMWSLGAALSSGSVVALESYSADWESLANKDIPEWVIDAKFGVYTHWGVFSVPAHGGPDYAPNLYSYKRDIKDTYSYHTEKYGAIEDFGYTDFIDKFTAPEFEASEWVGLMHEAGAKFGGICLVHHDGFLLWDSKVNRWNAGNMGPKKDIYGEIAAEVRKYPDMKLAATFHHGRTPGWMAKNLPKNPPPEAANWDVNNPEFKDFFWDSKDPEAMKEFSRQWQAKVQEVIDTYKPDLIWFDGLRSAMRHDHPPESMVKDVMAYYYNESDKRGQDVVIANKHAGEFNFPEQVGLRSYEGGRDMPEHIPGYYLTDRAIGYPWSYVNNKQYRDGADFHLGFLIDNVARGGIYLLSLTPKGDGSISDGEIEIMQGMGRWLKANGEAIYGTRRYSVYGEGQHLIYKKLKKGKTIYAWDYRILGAQDVRFTQKNNSLYAISLEMPQSRQLTLATFTTDYQLSTDNKIKRIQLLDSDLPVEWTRDDKGLHLRFPETYTGEFAHTFKIEVEGELIVTEPDAAGIAELARQGRISLQPEDEMRVLDTDE
ncbi:MAG: alpha-L-fucosidase [Pseudomonadales bacterium]